MANAIVLLKYIIQTNNNEKTNPTHPTNRSTQRNRAEIARYTAHQTIAKTGNEARQRLFNRQQYD